MVTPNNMASSVIVKKEADNAFNVPTDSEGDTSKGEDISLDELQELDCKFTTNPDKAKFPLGCKVWYNVRKSSQQRVKCASVVGVYMHYENKKNVYKLKSDTVTQCDTFLYEDQLLYGMNCPVQVTDASTGKIRDGVIVCPKRNQGDDGEQKVPYSYDLQFLGDVEFGVAADRIKYRFEKPASANANSKTKEVREESSAVKEVKAKEKNEEETRGLPKCRSIPTKSNDDAVSALKTSAKQQVDSATPTIQSDKATSGAISAVAKAEASKIDAGKCASLADMDRFQNNRQRTNVGEAGNSLVKIAKNKTESHDGVVRSIASNEYSKLADMNIQQIQQTVEVGLQLQSKRDRNVITATTASPSTRIDQETRSIPLGTSRWEPPTQDKSPQGKGEHGWEGGGVPSLERKRSSGLEVRSDIGERPNKMVKTEISDSKGSEWPPLTCTLTIPQWVYQIRGRKPELFFHIIGVKNDESTGYKTKRIESMTGCRIHISGRNHPMKIDITSNVVQNVAQGISMIEECLMEFVSDKNSEKKMLYELASTAEGSYKFKRNDGLRMLHRDKEWWALFELPYKDRGNGGEYHGKFLTRLQSLLSGDCRIELFGDTFGVPLEHVSPFVLIRGTKYKDVKDAVSIVRDKMRRHQNRGPGRGCDCMPKW